MLRFSTELGLMTSNSENVKRTSAKKREPKTDREKNETELV